MTATERTIVKSADIYLNLPPPSPEREAPPTLIFFITGNPGLIGYYHDFLDLLVLSDDPQNLDGRDIDRDRRDQIRAESSAPTSSSQDPRRDFIVAGYSLGGFEIQSGSETEIDRSSTTTTSSSSSSSPSSPLSSPSSNINSLLYPSQTKRKEIHGLQDQIELCYDRVCALTGEVARYYRQHHVKDGDDDGDDGDNENVSNLRNSNKQDGRGRGREEEKTDVKVVLMGHSVGAYIAMEMVRRHHQNQNHTKDEQSPSPLLKEKQNPSPSTLTTTTATFTITSLILLTPTILQISQSTNGRLATPLLSTLPFIPTLAQLTSTVLTSTTPSPITQYLVSKITGMEPGTRALEVTCDFLGASGCVKQSLYLARDEMVEIGADEWGEEVWGVLEEDELGREREEKGTERSGLWKAPKMYMLFAKSDRWVADGTRDEIMEIVGRRRVGEGVTERTGGPEVVVDEDGGLVHAWCVRQSDLVARRVRGWIGEVLNGL